MSFADYIIILLLIASGMIIVLLFIQRRLRQSHYAEQTLNMVRQEMEHLLMKMNSGADQHITLIDDRAQQLRKLLAQAQKTIQLLKKETEKNSSSVQNYHELLQKVALIKDEPEELPESKHQRILRYCREGMSVQDIATKLSVSVSEIELSLSLHGAGEDDAARKA